MIKINNKTYCKIYKKTNDKPTLRKFRKQKRTIILIMSENDIEECDLMSDGLIDYIPDNIDFSNQYVVFWILS